MIKKIRKRLEQRIVHSSRSYLGKKLVSPFFNADDDAAYYWEDLFEEAGVELCEPLKVGSSRGIFRVRHPQYGQCVLKGVFTTRAPRAGMGHLMVAQMMSDCPSPIFPEIYDATPAYTLEAHISGCKFRDWINNNFEASVVEKYLNEFSEWSKSPITGLEKGFLKPYEVRDICRKYINKCISHLRYSLSVKKFRSIMLGENIRKLSKLVDWIENNCGKVKINSGKMCGDLGNINVVVDERLNRIYNVDYEYISRGNWCFDICYLISSLNKMGDNMKNINKIKNLLLNKHVSEVRERIFFTVYADTLSILSATIYGRRERARLLLSESYENL